MEQKRKQVCQGALCCLMRTKKIDLHKYYDKEICKKSSIITVTLQVALFSAVDS